MESLLSSDSPKNLIILRKFLSKNFMVEQRICLKESKFLHPKKIKPNWITIKYTQLGFIKEKIQ